MKKKLIFILSFFFICLFFTYVILTLIENRKKEHLDAEKKIIEVTYNTIIESYRVYSNIIYFNKLNTKETKAILEKVYTSSKEEQENIRKELYEHLIDMYNNMDDYKLKQLHFHLKNNDSFLRFHRPNKYGDNLTNIRNTVAYVNKYQQAISGFEEGRIYNGYRFVYPLKNNDIYSYLIEYKEATPELIALFSEPNKEIFEVSQDDYGYFRSHLKSYVSDNGHIYVVGADMEVKDINKLYEYVDNSSKVPQAVKNRLGNILTVERDRPIQNLIYESNSKSPSKAPGKDDTKVNIEEINKARQELLSKKEDEKLIFKIIDESGKVAENCAVLRSAWVC